MNAYFISGLGADKRVFQKIKLPDGFNIIHIEWPALKANETLEAHAKRISLQIETDKPFILIGLSFGGMIVTELAKLYSPAAAFIISSVPVKSQFPPYFRLLGRLNIHRLVPAGILKWPNPFSFWLFGTKTKEEKELLKQILKDTEGAYIKWAINAILTWQNMERPGNIIHIHGTMDRILPIRYTRPDIKIEGGKHFMVFSIAGTINQILEKELKKL
jgi:pimeloyl-ACP methyl ester carboxylesterase